MAGTSLRRMLWKTPMRDLIRGRVTGRLDIEKLLEESGLSGAAADKVYRVVKYTRLWRLEKADVARELIAHFTDGLEARVSMEELVETFGDERQTAKLIRRAKKRLRPKIWHFFVWANACLLMFFGVYFLAALYLMTGSPSVTTDYLAQLNKNVVDVPKDEAAWPIYREAYIALDLDREIEWDSPMPYYRDLPPGEQEDYWEELEPPFTSTRWARLEKSLHPDDPGWTDTAAFLVQHTDTLALIREGASRAKSGYVVGFEPAPEDREFFGPDYYHVGQFEGPHPPLIGILLPHLGKIRSLARVLCADTSRAITESDGDTASANIIAILGLAGHCDEQPLLITGLVRLSIQRIAFQSAQEVLTNKPEILTDAQLRNLAHEITADKLNYDAWYNGERLWFYDYLQRVYSDDGHGGGHITNEGVKAHSGFGNPHSRLINQTVGNNAASVFGLPALAVLVAPRDEMREVYDSLMDRSIIDLGKPLWIDDGQDSADQMFTNLMTTNRSRIRYMPIDIFLPAISAVNESINIMEGYREGLLIGIALELYRREHRDWPGALDQLVPRYLPSVPVDRLTGGRLTYQVGEDGPVVYCRGVDGDDDGGRPPIDKHGDQDNSAAGPRSRGVPNPTHTLLDGDWVLWPVPEEK